MNKRIGNMYGQDVYVESTGNEERDIEIAEKIRKGIDRVYEDTDTCPTCNEVKKLYNLDNSVCPHTNLLRLSMDTFDLECKDCGASVTPRSKVGMVIKEDPDDFSKSEVYTG
jgi:uncharacterized protein with PIN domain